jgi:hypothetical protein
MIRREVGRAPDTISETDHRRRSHLISSAEVRIPSTRREDHYRKGALIFDQLMQAEAEVQQAHSEVEWTFGAQTALPAHKSVDALAACPRRHGRGRSCRARLTLRAFAFSKPVRGLDARPRNV